MDTANWGALGADVVWRDRRREEKQRRGGDGGMVPSAESCGKGFWSAGSGGGRNHLIPGILWSSRVNQYPTSRVGSLYLSLCFYSFLSPLVSLCLCVYPSFYLQRIFSVHARERKERKMEKNLYVLTNWEWMDGLMEGRTDGQ